MAGISIDSFWRSLDRFMEDGSVDGFLPQWLKGTSAFSGSKAELGSNIGEALDFVTCLLVFHLGRCLRQDAGLAGPLL